MFKYDRANIQTHFTWHTRRHTHKAWILNHRDTWLQSWMERPGRNQHSPGLHLWSVPYELQGLTHEYQNTQSPEKEGVKTTMAVWWSFWGHWAHTGHRWARQHLFHQRLLKWPCGSDAVLLTTVPNGVPTSLLTGGGSAQSRKKRAGFTCQPSNRGLQEWVRGPPRDSQEWQHCWYQAALGGDWDECHRG